MLEDEATRVPEGTTSSLPEPRGKPALSTLTPIGEVARRFGVRASTLRYYEERGLVVPTARRGNGRRYYSLQDLQRLALVRSLHTDALMSLDEIVALLAGPAQGEPAWHRIVSEQLSLLDRRMKQLQSAHHLLSWMGTSPQDSALGACPAVRDQLEHMLTHTTEGMAPPRGRTRPLSRRHAAE